MTTLPIKSCPGGGCHDGTEYVGIAAMFDEENLALGGDGEVSYSNEE